MKVKKSRTITESIQAENATFTADITKETIEELGDTASTNHNIKELRIRKAPDKSGRQRNVVKLKGQDAKDLIALFLSLTGALVEDVASDMQNVNIETNQLASNQTKQQALNEMLKPRELPPNAQNPADMVSQADLVKKISKKAKREEDVIVDSIKKDAAKRSNDNSSRLEQLTKAKAEFDAQQAALPEEQQIKAIPKSKKATSPKELASRLIKKTNRNFY